MGIGGSALGPQFVAEALAPDNPPLKVNFKLIMSSAIGTFYLLKQCQVICSINL